MRMDVCMHTAVAARGGGGGLAAHHPERHHPEAHVENDLFRGDMQARASFYTQMLQNGVMNINEVRATEELNPTPGGDTHTVQVNQIALDRLGAYSDKISSDDNGQSPA